jgi:ADP-ribose pyrophosphatase YjhB (NUDIX family)
MKVQHGTRRYVCCVPIKGGEVCLITTSNTRRWGFPKGKVNAGESDSDAASREAYEESGCKGKVAFCSTTSIRKATGEKIVLQVFTMQVDEVTDDFPESDIRRVRWVTPELAKKICRRYLPILEEVFK